MDGNPAGALSEVEQALAVAPGDANLLTFKGVLQQKLGQNAAAEQTFAAAEAVFGNRETFLLTRGQTYLRMGQGEAALADAQAAITLNPKSAIGYLLFGQANEALENYQEAIAAYQQAGTLADAQNNPQIAAIARMNLATLMQRLPLQPEGND
jgi:tetratricopeptide (TPR) repeat protein